MGHEKIVKLLLNKKVFLNISDINKMSALIHATKKNYGNIVKLLLDAGACTNVQDKYNMTALIYSVELKFFNICNMLVFNPKTNLEFQDNRRITALYVACQLGDLRTVKLLLLLGAKCY